VTTKVSPSRAHNSALKQVRARLKAQREGKQVESPAEMADHLVALLQPACDAHPAPDSPAYRSHVETRFADRFFELCSKYPAPVRRP
jgi:hypothetical protein